MRKPFLLPLAALVGFAVAVVPGAVASDTATVTAASNYAYYTPNKVAITPGGTVTFTHSMGTTYKHNVHFSDATPFGGQAKNREPTNLAWNDTGSFPTAGEFHFYCDVHGSMGMTGVVYVNAAGTVPTATTPGGTTTGGGTGTGTGPGGGPPPGSPGDTTKPSLTGVKAASGHFCTKKSKTCKKPGVTLKLKLSEPAKVTATVLKRKRGTKGKFRKLGTVKLSGKTGSNTFKFKTASGKLLRPADYKVELAAVDPVGNKSSKKTVRFFVRPS
jgi:plastocyanin